jgi:hypothetical protein
VANGRTGRPPKPQDTETFEVTIPAKAHGYLLFLAKNTVLGASVNDVAALILVNALTHMVREKFHDHTIPQG